MQEIRSGFRSVTDPGCHSLCGIQVESQMRAGAGLPGRNASVAPTGGFGRRGWGGGLR
jgi:hypothetical protein